MLSTQKDALSIVPPITVTCKFCHAEENIIEYDPPGETLLLMSRDNVCAKCAYWMDKIKHPDVGREIIGGHYFIVHPFVKRPNNVIKGTEGKEFYIRETDGVTVQTLRMLFSIIRKKHS